MRSGFHCNCVLSYCIGSVCTQHKSNQQPDAAGRGRQGATVCVCLCVCMYVCKGVCVCLFVYVCIW